MKSNQSGAVITKHTAKEYPTRIHLKGIHRPCQRSSEAVFGRATKFIYFDNDAKVRALFDAQSLTARVEKLLRL